MRLREVLSLIDDRSILVPVRDENDSLLEHVSIDHAYGYAVQGAVEGVLTAGGRLKYLRRLPADIRKDANEVAASEKGEEYSDSRSTAFAVPNIGVYREAVCKETGATIPDVHGNQVPEMAVIGYTYQFALLRGAGLKDHAAFNGARVAQPQPA